MIDYPLCIVFENIYPATIACDNPVIAHVIVNNSEIGKIEYDSNRLGRDMIQNRRPKRAPLSVLNLSLKFPFAKLQVNAIITDVTKG